MRFPPRLGHLATRAVVVARLAPTYAAVHEIDDDEAIDRLERALQGSLLDDMLEATWEASLGSTVHLDEQGILDKIADSLKTRPLRPGRETAITPGWNAVLARLDVDMGVASDSARRVLEGDEGRKRLAEGIIEVGKFLCVELMRK